MFYKNLHVTYVGNKYLSTLVTNRPHPHYGLYIGKLQRAEFIFMLGKFHSSNMLNLSSLKYVNTHCEDFESKQVYLRLCMMTSCISGIF